VVERRCRDDIVFLRHCGYAVAVANALPDVKATAHVVTTESHGAGVEELIATVLEQPDRLLARPIVA
jgi:hydroxymethylpyrimidine pyrophosphatase-like HAD family hydrolase